MAMIDSAKLIEARTTYSLAFNKGLNAVNGNLLRSALCNEEKSTGKTAKYSIAGGLRAMQKWTGERVYDDLVRYAAQVDNDTFSMAVEVPIDELEDDQIGGFDTDFQAMGENAGNWGEELVSAALLAGESTAAYDGVNFFASGHKLDPKDPNATSYANLFTGTALNATNFDVVYNAMSTIKAKNGNYMPFGRRVLLIVPPQLETTAKTIVAASQNANGSTNVIAGKAEVLKVQSLAGAPLDWYLAECGSVRRPALFQTRKAPIMTAPRGTEDYILEKRLLRWVAEARGAAALMFPWMLAKAKG